MMRFRSMVLHADRLPSPEQVGEVARQFGVDIAFEESFEFSRNPGNRAGRVSVMVNGCPSEFGYAIDPLWLLVDDKELPAELTDHGDVLVTFAVPSAAEAIIAAAELTFARESNAFGWRSEELIPPQELERGAEVALSARATRAIGKPH